jgi:hypothetical protein
MVYFHNFASDVEEALFARQVTIGEMASFGCFACVFFTCGKFLKYGK